MRYKTKATLLLVLTALVASCVSVTPRTAQDVQREQQLAQEIFGGRGPVSNLYDEGFEPLPGVANTYYIPGNDIYVRCSDRFTLNASLKRTFRCFHVDRRMRKIQGTDFDVQINPWNGDEGFSPYRPHY